jgi:uncharacterized protein (TIRG00374 family)
VNTRAPRSRILLAVKLSLGLALLIVLLLWNDNWRRVWEAFSNARPLYLIPFLAITFPLIGSSCLKWGLFLQERGLKIPFHRLFSLYVMGSFFNNFLPTMFGGDLVRAYVLGRQIESQTQSIASVFLERITGLVALVSLATICFLFNPELRQEPVVAVSIVVMGGGCLALFTVLWKPELAHWVLMPLRHHERSTRLLPKLTQFREYVLFFKDRPALVLKAMVYSFTFHFLAGVNVYLACLVLDIPFSLFHAIVLTPIVLLVSSIPLTVNGLGVWEWAFSVYLAQGGMQFDQGLAVALILRGKNILISLFGGLLFLVERMPTNAEADRGLQGEHTTWPRRPRT